MSEINIVQPYLNANDSNAWEQFNSYMQTLPMFRNAMVSLETDYAYKYYYYGWRLIPGKTGTADGDHYLRMWMPYFIDYVGYFCTFTDNSSFAWVLHGNDNRNYYNGYYSQAANAINYNGLRPLLMYLVKGTNTNGVWFINPEKRISGAGTQYVSKIFITRCINELTGTEEYIPVAGISLLYGHNDNHCFIYPYENYRVDIRDYKIAGANVGFSNTYVLRQLRYENYFFPNIYIISGGLFISDKDVITIDNNEYVHMCNDIYIKL